MTSVAVAVLRALLGALLIAAGGMKMGHAPALAEAIASFRLLPGALVAPLALVLPYFEVLLGLYLILGLFTRIVAIIGCAQFVAYGIVIASAVVRHIPANCGCFGPQDAAPADWPHVAFDFLLAAVAAFIAWRAPGALALDRRLSNS